MSTPKNIKAALVIIAINEDRSWFPATRLLHNNGATDITFIGSPGAHREVGGHWQSSMHVQQLNMHAMVHYASAAGFDFSNTEMDRHVGYILNSSYGRNIALRSYPRNATMLEKWSRAAELKYWIPYTQEQFIVGIHSTNEEHWKPGGFGSQKGNTPWGIVAQPYVSPLGRALLGDQPILSHYPRSPLWVTNGLWSVYPGQDSAQPYIQSLYGKRINGTKGGWK